MTDLRQAAQQALEALENERYVTKYTHIVEAVTALKAALAQPEQEPTPWRDMVVVTLVREGIDKHKARELADHFAAAQPEFVRTPKIGDKVICIEDESLGEVVSLTAGGSPDIAFDDGSRGTYMLREFAELFGYVTPPAAQPEQEPVAYYHPHKGFYWAKPTHIAAPTVVDVPPVPLYVKWIAAQRPWQGLTKEQRDDFANEYGSYESVCAIEKELREKNGH